MAILRPLREDGLDPHAVISFEPEPEDDSQLRAKRTGSQRAHQDWLFVLKQDEGYDMRVGDKRKRDALLAAAAGAPLCMTRICASVISKARPHQWRCRRCVIGCCAEQQTNF